MEFEADRQLGYNGGTGMLRIFDGLGKILNRYSDVNN